MKKVFGMMCAVVMLLGVVGSTGSAQMMKGDDPMVGGAAMYRSKTIVENALNSPIHTTLVAAVKAAGLVDTLMGKGPFTVFAPENSAFDKLPAGTVNTLVMPENKAMLTKILTYHVVAGNYDSKKIAKMIKRGHGTATFKTVSGGNLSARMSGNDIILVDEKGGTSRITTANVYQKNGVIHSIDTVLMPN
ncbi:MAG: hypothetical protein QOE33_466 [Acidobacteriota bacterium]|nr:hypothetical protein [Acidobacteriota bacterium]